MIMREKWKEENNVDVMIEKIGNVFIDFLLV